MTRPKHSFPEQNFYVEGLVGKAARLRGPERVQRLEVGRVVAEMMRGLDRPRVLDIGTGSGLFAHAFARAGAAAVAGVDLSPELLAAARQAVQGGDFREADAEHLPFENGRFDLCFMGHALHEVGSVAGALREARRVCAGGRLGVLEWPYHEEKLGPPLARRLTSAQVKQAAAKAGWAQCRELRLREMVLFVLEGEQVNG